MPLHLLGKKSWNVYNSDNVDRVRRDEAAAAAAEEAEEQRMQELDAARRTAILRGETPPPIPAEEPCTSNKRSRNYDEDTEHRRMRDWEREDRKKKRRLRGEDDTDRDIRLARADAEAGEGARSRLAKKPDEDATRAKKEDKERAIVDAKGNISLFDAPAEEPKRKSRDEVKEARKRDEEQGVGMRFSHAAGYKTNGSTPWYADGKAQKKNTLDEERKDAFGNIDPARKQRDQTRTSTNDPMAFMNKAQAQLRQAENDRAEWDRQKRKEIEALEREEKEERRRRRKRREREKSVDSLEGFSLDVEDNKRARSRSDRDRERHRHNRRRHDDESHRERDRERRRTHSDHDRHRR